MRIAHLNMSWNGILTTTTKITAKYIHLAKKLNYPNFETKIIQHGRTIRYCNDSNFDTYIIQHNIQEQLGKKYHLNINSVRLQMELLPLWCIFFRQETLFDARHLVDNCLPCFLFKEGRQVNFTVQQWKLKYKTYKYLILKWTSRIVTPNLGCLSDSYKITQPLKV